MIRELYKCHTCDTLETKEKLTELGPDVYECDQCWLTAGGEEFTPLDLVSSKDLTNAIMLTIDWLTENNMNGLAKLVEWNAADLIETYSDRPVEYNDDLMLKGNKALLKALKGLN